MTAFGPGPSEDAEAAERDAWAESRDTRQRVRDVLVGLREPVSAAAVAERAECSPNAARKHLADLADLGVARAVTDGETARYVRNDEYLRWRRADELAGDESVEALLDDLASLEARDEAFGADLDAASPDDVTFPDDADHETVEDLWNQVSKWETVRREMDVVRDAIRMARRRRDGLTA